MSDVSDYNADDVEIKDVTEIDDVGDTSGDDIEAKARRMGWRPESEWDSSRAAARGARRPEHFLTAEEFVRQVDESVPIMRERLHHQDEQIAKLRTDQIEAQKKLDDAMALVKTLHDDNKAIGQRAYQKARKELEQQRDEAVSLADVDRHKEILSELDALDKEWAPIVKDEPAPKTETTPPPATQTDPVTAAWIGRNPWFTKDSVLNAYAREENQKIWAANPNISKEDALKETKKRVVTRFPEKFGVNPNRGGRASVNGGNGAPPDDQGGASGGKFDDLPQDAKDTYEGLRRNFEQRGIKYTKEEYATDYFQG